jgi:hypothetical protein
MVGYITGLAGALLLLFFVIDVTFSRSIIYKVESHQSFEKIKAKIDAATDLRQRYGQELWWQGDESDGLLEDQRYLNWLMQAYTWAKQPWWKRYFIDLPPF